MMKKYFYNICIITFLLACGFPLSAQNVDKSVALEKAYAFFDRSGKSRSAVGRDSQKTRKLTLATNRDEFYVFNDEDNGGWVIISGEERMPDVLGYSTDGYFNADSIPCNMKAWMENYADQVAYLRMHSEARVTSRTSSERKNIGPLLTCWYNQTYPYNKKCPVVGGVDCYTGCVATAMAQIMYYHQWPKQTTTTIPAYTTKTLGIEMPAIPVTTIDWGNMLNDYNSYEKIYSDAQINAISTLMLLCGCGAEMDYNTSGSRGSSSYTYAAAEALRLFFDYNDMLCEIKRDDYETDVWEQMIYDELYDGRPVLYDGFSDDNSSGHAFVIDGYDDGYFHVNWGWGGIDGYVIMTDVDGWLNYYYHQNAIIGIRPASDEFPNRYGVLKNGKMTLYYDTKKSQRSGTVLPQIKDIGDTDYAKEITECVIDESFANLRFFNLNYFFGGWSNLKSISGLEYLNTAFVVDMSLMFFGCSSLRSISGLEHLNTTSVVNMNSMFWDCSSLTSLDLSSFKTDNAIDMSGMFGWCSSLTTIYVSELWNTSKVKVEDSYYMFDSCSNLVGGAGTKYDSNHVDKKFARIDKGSANPGYLTYKSAPASGISPTSYKEEQPVKWFDIGGKQLERPKKGLNIMRMGNGNTKKVIIK